MRRRQTQATFSLFAFQDIITAVTGVSLLIVMILALALTTSRTRVVAGHVDDINSVKQQVSILEGQVAAVRKQITERKTRIERHIVTPEDLAIAIQAGKQLNSALRHEISQLTQRLDELENTNDDDVDQIIKDKERELTNQKRSTQRTTEDLKSELSHVEEQLAELRTSNRFFFNPPEGFAKQPWLVEVFAHRILVAPVDQSTQPKAFDTINQFLRSVSDYDSADQYFVFFVHPSGISNYDQIVASRELSSFDFGVDVLDRNATVIAGN